MKRDRTSWSTTMVASVQSEVKEELNGVLAASDLAGRLKHALAGVRDLQEAQSPRDRLRCYVYIVSSLLHQQLYGGLKENHVKQLADLAEIILRTEGIQPLRSRLSFLYGDLHLALSQIHWKNGRPWAAAWERQMARFLTRRAEDKHEGYNKLGLGLRSLRLGHTDLALDNFAEAEACGLTDRQFLQSRLGAIQALRLQKHTRNLIDVIEETLADSRPNERERQELTWLRMIAKFQEDGDFSDLVSSLTTRKTHRVAAYFLEALLLAYTSTEKKWIGRLPTLKTLSRHRTIKPQSEGVLYDSVRRIEECYDYVIPLEIRLGRLGDILAASSQLVSIDSELLVWAAAGRWLNRSKSYELAKLALREYRSITLRVSCGKWNNILPTMVDLAERF